MECKDFEPSIIQENKILLLCKRLDKFDIDKIETISEIEQAELLPILDELIKENKILFRNNTYFYLKKVKKPKPKIFEHHSKETINLIIRCFCSNIPTMQTGNIVGIGDGSVGKFYQYFREIIYNKQTKNLQEKYSQDPQIVRIRTFFEQTVYFYTYKNNIFVSETELKSRDERNFTKDEIKEFKKVYSYISRILFHNQNKHFLHQKIAEGIWRRNKDFENLYFELNDLIFS